jgi:hypothetical protein
MTALSSLAETHSESELLDHLALYKGSEELSAFAAELGLRYSEAG